MRLISILGFDGSYCFDNFNNKISPQRSSVVIGMSGFKSHQESDQNSLILEYPFLMSSIKKPENRQMGSMLLKQTGKKMNREQEFRISRSPTPKNLSQNIFSPEQDINNDSSIEFYEQSQVVDETVQREIQELENEITDKLNEQYDLLRQRLKKKSKQRENLLRTFRQLSTLEPLQQKPLQDNFQANIVRQNPSSKPQRMNPLNTKLIKNRIIRHIEESQSIQNIKNLHKTTIHHEPYPHDHSSSNSNHNFNNAFDYTFKFQNLTQNNHQTPHLLKSIKHKEVKSITKIDNSDDLIRQMSQQLKKMEFKKVQDIAKGKFTFLKKK